MSIVFVYDLLSSFLLLFDNRNPRIVVNVALSALALFCSVGTRVQWL